MGCGVVWCVVAQGLWMSHHDNSLNKMRTGIEQIESRNTALEIHSHNYEKL
jgi:hypothetical protein